MVVPTLIVMSQIGTPPAGWYVDPSGQHRARFWDGAAWTEQVSDEPAGSSNGSAVTHGAAATVAGVAQALATVADPPPGALASAMPSAMSGAMSGEMSSTMSGGMAPAESPDPFGASYSTSDEAAVVTAPVAGWYPDPAERYQARYWDGATWTDRVADRGVEGSDPIAASPTSPLDATAGDATTAGGTRAVDPSEVAWTAQLLGGTDADGFTATAVIPDPSGPPPMTAGQASLASLPGTDEAVDAPKATRSRPRGKVYAAGWMVLIGAFGLLLGSTMEWMQVRGPQVNDFSTSSGVDLGDGRITIALAFLLALFGAGILTGRLRRVGGARVGAMGALVAGAAAVAVTAVDIADVADRASRLGVAAGAVSDVGNGLWLCFVAALFAVAGGLMAFANR